MGSQRRRGFTIVELLIVIVVIAILAAITIAAFNGIQQRAKNAAKFATVQSATKLIQLYKTEHESYPVTSDGGWCLTQDNACRSYNNGVVSNSNTTLMNALKENGIPPTTSGDNTAGDYYGIQYLYSSTRTLDSVSNPLIIIFWLDGTNQMCAGAVSGMVSVTDGSGTMTPADRANGNVTGGKTRCYLMFPN